MNRALLRERLNRAELLALPVSERNRPLSVAVHRNHAFELVASVLNPFLNESGVTAVFHYSGYDDSLAFGSAPSEADLHLVWLDCGRYENLDTPRSSGRSEGLAAWLAGRLAALREMTVKPVLVACCGASDGAGIEAVLPADALYCDLDAALGPDTTVYSDRLEAFTGTRLTNEGALLAARLLGLRYIPALTVPALKALVLDLDNTLYEGVLGEDGPDGVKPYEELQHHLKSLAAQGFLLALSSKNEERDVRELFARRRDFPLAWGDFAATAVGWMPKAEGILSIAEAFNIGTDAMLFVDDNPGEIAQAAHAVPGLRVLAAGSEAETLAALRWQPGLFKVRLTHEDALRGADIAANARREALRKAVSPREYLRELEIELTFYVNPVAQQARITELLNKTNQFILAYRRSNESETAAFLQGDGACVVTAAMKDRLSDSGVIAVALLERQKGTAVLCELAVSCRALGRGIEGDMIAKMLTLGCETLGTGKALFAEYERGPRNGPGLAWLQGVAGAQLADKGRVMLAPLPVADLDMVSVIVRKGEPQ